MNPFKYRSLWTLVLGGAILLTTGCKKDDDEDEEVTPTPTPSNLVTIDQPISSTTTWTADRKYLIKGFVEVELGATLTIQPGTVIFGDKATKGTLIINRGAKLIAVGTPSSPIVFTSAEPAGSRAPGDWGGIIICGRAPINLPGGTGVVEGGVEAVFGGNDPADDSGSLSYVRIEFPGIAFQENNEINGITLAGVGNGTDIDHIQVSYSGDDSFEWFGGTVNNKHLIAFGGLDDDFDMDNGYSGKLQFGVVLRDPNQADVSGSNGLEHDNDASGSGATPFTTPVISNISVFGPQATPTTTFNSNYKRANHLRRNTHTRLFNSVFAGWPTGLLLDGSLCETNADAGELKVKNNVYAAIGTLTAVASGSTYDVGAFFTSNGNTSLANNSDLGVVDAFNRNAPNFTLNGGSPLASGALFSDSDLTDPFFTSVPYKGAFGSENWTSGWANWDPQNTVY
ncbi:MAG TPA: hypothetical protein VGE21_06700 [Flavobacteriales bacterium]